MYYLGDNTLDLPVNPITMQPYDDLPAFDEIFADELAAETAVYDADPTGGQPSRY